MCRTCDSRFRKGQFKGVPKWREPVDKTEKFWASVTKTKGCWLWTGTVYKQSGYGYHNYTVDGKTLSQLAHRFSFELRNGPIPPGVQLYHECLNKTCVNPDHLLTPSFTDRWRQYLTKRAAGREPASPCPTSTQ